MSSGLRVAIYDTPQVVHSALAATLRAAGHTVLTDRSTSFSSRLAAAPGDADVWLTKWTSGLKDPQVFTSFRPRQAIVSLSVGTDHIAVQELNDQHGIAVHNCPTFCSNSVAEHALTLALMALHGTRSLLPDLSNTSNSPIWFSNFEDAFSESAILQVLMRIRQIKAALDRVQRFDYKRYDEPWSNMELANLSIGILGDERPTPNLIKMLSGFGANIYGFNLHPSLQDFALTQLPLERIFELSDYVFDCGINTAVSDLGVYRAIQSRSQLFDSRELDPSSWLSRSKVSVLGAGRIGSTIATRCLSGFNCGVTILHSAPKTHTNPTGANSTLVLDQALDADFVFVALPLSDRTRLLIDERALSVNRDNIPVIVNISRDEIVDSEALYAALQSDRVRFYATDTLPKDKVLWAQGQPDELTVRFAGSPRVIATPHEGDCSVASISRLLPEVIERMGILSDVHL